MNASPNSFTTAELEVARTLLARMGFTPEQLLRATPWNTTVPTFDEYIGRVSQAVSSGTRRVYDTYWRQVSEVWGGRPVDEPTALEIKQLAERVKSQAVIRRNSRSGRTAAEHLISALRCLYHYAVADGLIGEGDNPAARVAKPAPVG
jgi:hypothetical protein